MSFKRIIKRNKEKEELENIRKTYGKKPKEKCPKCGKKSLFFKNDKKEIYCVRCDKIVRLDNV